MSYYEEDDHRQCEAMVDRLEREIERREEQLAEADVCAHEARQHRSRAEAWKAAADALVASMDYQDTDWRDSAYANDLDRAALEALEAARKLEDLP